MRIDIRKLLFGGFLIVAFAVFAGTASAQMAAIAAIDEPEPAEGGGSAARAGGGRVTSGRPPRSGTQSKPPARAAKKPKPPAGARTHTSPAPPPPPAAAATYRGPVLGDRYTFLNYEVESVEKPYYTRAAKASGAKGLVQVEVLVSTDGSVLSAKARTGNKELWPEAERAALASKFKRPTADGRPARAIGFLVYRFGPAED